MINKRRLQELEKKIFYLVNTARYLKTQIEEVEKEVQNLVKDFLEKNQK